MNILVKLSLLAKANGRSVKEELEAIVDNAYQAHCRKNAAALVAMRPSAPVVVEAPSNPSLAFSHVTTEEVPDPVVVPVPTPQSVPVSINRPRPSPRRPHRHDSHT